MWKIVNEITRNTCNFRGNFDKFCFFFVDHGNESSIVKHLRDENFILKQALQSLQQTVDHQETVLSAPENTLLNVLVESAFENSMSSKHGYRHNIVLKNFACYVKLVGGALLFETLHANLSTSIPSSSTLSRFMDVNGSKIVEGVLRVDELKTYLVDRDAPLVVIVAEDATRNVGKISYDSVTNQLVGFVPTLNNHGMPITNMFPARNALEIQNHFENDKNVIGTMAYTITAQALKESVPPFILTLFSIDNKFSSTDVTNRHAYIQCELGKKGISVYIFSSDGDSK